jgi:PAS domain-containing protein
MYPHTHRLPISYKKGNGFDIKYANHFMREGYALPLYKYRQERIHTRMGYVQYIYKNRDTYSAFEDFSFPIVLYDRKGIIAAANKRFRDFTEIKEDDIRPGKINIFDYLDDENAGLLETAHNAFDGKGGATSMFITICIEKILASLQE